MAFAVIVSSPALDPLCKNLTECLALVKLSLASVWRRNERRRKSGVLGVAASDR